MDKCKEWREQRRKWLSNPKNRERDRAAARERYHARKKAAKVFVQQTLPLR